MGTFIDPNELMQQEFEKSMEETGGSYFYEYPDTYKRLPKDYSVKPNANANGNVKSESHNGGTAGSTTGKINDNLETKTATSNLIDKDQSNPASAIITEKVELDSKPKVRESNGKVNRVYQSGGKIVLIESDDTVI